MRYAHSSDGRFAGASVAMGKWALSLFAAALTLCMAVPAAAFAADSYKEIRPVTPLVAFEEPADSLPYYDMRTGKVFGLEDDELVDDDGAASAFVVLSDKAKECKDIIAAGYERGLDEISLRDSNGRYAYSRDDMMAAFACLRQSGEYYYVGSRISWSTELYSGNNYVTCIYPQYIFDSPEEIAQARAAMEAKITTILAAIPEAMSDVLKVQYVHDYLALHCNYDESVYDDPSSTPAYSYNAYGILMAGSAVCDGYTQAAILLLNRLGIGVGYVSSDAMNHAWNLVELGGKWYHMDITWDDPVLVDGYGNRVIDPDFVQYKYFLKSDASFVNLEHHDWDADETADSDYPSYSRPSFANPANLCADYGHAWQVDHVISEATCTDDGSVQTVCSRCGKEDSHAVSALGHDDSGEWTVNVEPTCVEEGSEHLCCTRCGEVIGTRSIAALGHDLDGEWTVEIAPTCAGDGVETYACPRCNQVIDSRSIDALGHDYAGTVTEPTCTEAGFTTYVCSRCNDEYVADEVEALGHDLNGEWTVETAPTCADDGIETYACPRCEQVIDSRSVDALGHDDGGEWVVDEEATCMEDGSEHLCCVRCDAVIETRSIDALGHDYVGAVTEPTCTEAGFTTYACSRCDDEYVADEVEALGHDCVAVKGYAAQIGKVGLTDGSKCQRCGSWVVEQEEIPALNPKGVSLSKVTAGKKAFTAKWKKSSSTNCTGYQIRCSLKSDMSSGVKTYTVSKRTTVSKKVSKLKAKKKYYVQIRVYKTVNGKKWYSDWSKAKTVKTK